VTIIICDMNLLYIMIALWITTIIQKLIYRIKLISINILINFSIFLQTASCFL